MDVSARDARADDLPEVAELAMALTATLREQRGGAVWYGMHGRTDPVIDALRTSLAEDHQIVAVGMIDGTIVGYAVAYEQQLIDGATIAAIPDLFVMEAARGVGVGSALMNHLTDWALGRGLDGLDSLALPGDRATKNFFESFGLVARAISVYRPLKP